VHGGQTASDRASMGAWPCNGPENESFLPMVILIILLSGAVAGWLAGKLVTGSGFGLTGNIVIGIAGAVIAHLILPRGGIAMGGGLLRAMLTATIGAVILLVIVRLIRRA
jgi:uncharacterized membrane protein YeaQ/YmgE (transglycosylase-associated protein family)